MSVGNDSAEKKLGKLFHEVYNALPDWGENDAYHSFRRFLAIKF